MFDEFRAFDIVAPSRIVFGWGRRTEAGALARSLGRRAFVVCGSRSLESNGPWGELRTSLHEARVTDVSLGTISHEPLVEDVDRAVATLRENHAGSGDLVVALGGGSAIDLAKAAAALATQRTSTSARDYLEGVGTGLKIVDPPLPVLAMPTTGGTGSEATKNAVISSYDPPFKKSLRSELMVPRIVLIDPELTVTVPPCLTAWTGMDALTQCIESFMTRTGTRLTLAGASEEVRFVRAFALEGVRLASGALEIAYRDGTSRQARDDLARAALYSGIALTNSGLGMAHGVAASLGIHCRVPHGLACAVMLPAAMEANSRMFTTIPEWPNLVHHLLGRPINRLDATTNAASACVERIKDLQKSLGIPGKLSAIGVRLEQIPAIVRDSRGNSMSGNPRELDDRELTQILEDLL